MRQLPNVEEQIADLIGRPGGYEVGVFAMLSVYRLEDGRYAVHENGPDRGSGEVRETLHATALEAATEFERVRKARHLGFEFEVATAAIVANVTDPTDESQQEPASRIVELTALIEQAILRNGAEPDATSIARLSKVVASALLEQFDVRPRT